jgi:hypothetical protein
MADVYANVQNVLKENYASDASSQNQDFGIIYKSIKKDIKLGKAFNCPIVTSNPASMTTNFAGSNAIALRGATGPNIVNARLDGVSYVLESVVSREDMERGDSEGKSVETVPALTAKELKKSFINICEIDAFYGLFEYAIINASNDAGGVAQTTITDESWAPGIWQAMVGGKVFVSGFAGDRPFIVKNFDAVNQAVGLQEITVGDAALLNGAGGAAIYPYHANAGLNPITMQGLFSAIGASATSSVYGLSTLTYPQLISYKDVAFGAVTAQKLMDFVSKTGSTEEMNVYISPKSYGYLIDAESFLDTTTKSDHMILKGANLIHVYAHPCVKESHIFAVPTDSLKWVSTAKVGLIELSKGNYAQSKEGTDSHYMRIAQNVAVITSKPGLCAFASGVTNA